MGYSPWGCIEMDMTEQLTHTHTHTHTHTQLSKGFPGDGSGEESACQCRQLRRCGFDPGLGRSPGVGNGNLFQCYCLGNPMD